MRTLVAPQRLQVHTVFCWSSSQSLCHWCLRTRQTSRGVMVTTFLREMTLLARNLAVNGVKGTGPLDSPSGRAAVLSARSECHKCYTLQDRRWGDLCRAGQSRSNALFIAILKCRSLGLLHGAYATPGRSPPLTSLRHHCQQMDPSASCSPQRSGRSKTSRSGNGHSDRMPQKGAQDQWYPLATCAGRGGNEPS
jgi:hypothetical protein